MDLYALLGVARDAGRDVIRKAFRRKVKVAHPDAGGDVVAFTQLMLAHDVLVDEERRQVYDEHGVTAPPRPDDYVRQVAITILAELLKTILTVDGDLDPNKANLIALGVEHLEVNIRKLEQQLSAVRLAKQRAKGMMGRWRSVKGENILGSILNSQNDRLEESEANVLGQIQAHEIAIEILQDHAFSYDAQGGLVVSDRQFYQARPR